MRIYEGYWRSEISAATIEQNERCPEVGVRAFTCFGSRWDHPEGKRQFVLWHSLLSEINGWGDEPDEVGQTMLVECEIVGIERPPFSLPSLNRLVEQYLVPSDCYRYEVLPVSVTNLAEFLTQYQSAERFVIPGVGLESGACRTVWELADDIQHIELQSGLHFFCASESESIYVAIVAIRANCELRLKLHATHGNGCEEIEMLDLKLSARDAKVFRSAINS